MNPETPNPTTPPEATAPPPGDPQPAPAAEEKKQTRNGNGNIARLSVPLRDQVGVMVLDGVPYAEIIASLGEAGEGIRPVHITNWKSGTFGDWLQDYERRQAMVDKHQSAQALVTHTDGTALSEAGLRLAAAQMNEFLLAVKPAAFAEALVEKPELYLRLINTISRVNESTVLAARARAAQQALLKAKKQTSLGGKPDNIPESENMTEITHRLKLL